MSASTANPVPPDMSHWDPALLQEYLRSVQEDDEYGVEEDEAISSGLEDDDAKSDVSANNAVPINPADALDADLGLLHIATDIASDDSGFSSEADFRDDSDRKTQKERHQLAMGRLPAEVNRLSVRELIRKYLAYISLLRDADKDLGELVMDLGEGVVENTVGDSDVDGVAAVQVLALRSRPAKEIRKLKKPLLHAGLIMLAQALFRRQKRVKIISEAAGYDD